MWRRIATGLLAVAAVWGSAWADKTNAKDDRSLDENTELGTAVSYKNLTIVPVLAKKAVADKDKKEYLVLDEAFDKKLVKVKEKEDESVNELTLENKSDKPLFLMAGEMIIGGKQDRIIGKDTIIPPKEKVEVPVFCVEHGRWTDEDGKREFRSGKTLAHTKLRMQANYKAQQDVWNEVAAKTKARKVETSTGTYRTVANKAEVEKVVKPYAENIGPLVEKVEGADRMVGFVVVVNGQIVGMDTFGSAKLFSKVRDKLLRSYYVDAVDIPEDKEAAATVPAPAKIREYSKQGDKEEKRTVLERKKAKIKTEQFENDSSAGDAVMDAEPAAVQPEVYKSTYTKSK